MTFAALIARAPPSVITMQATANPVLFLMIIAPNAAQSARDEDYSRTPVYAYDPSTNPEL
jgi:hypothetical protein